VCCFRLEEVHNHDCNDRSKGFTVHYHGGLLPQPGRQNSNVTKRPSQLRRSHSFNSSRSSSNSKVPSASPFWICSGCNREFEAQRNLSNHQSRSKSDLCSNRGWTKQQSKKPTFSSADQYKGGGVLHEIGSYVPGMPSFSCLVPLPFLACFLHLE
jgi:hypothetical protein